MFGYVRVDSAELKVREYEFYRGTYCGLCRTMGKCTGQCSRMTLSYDFAFLAVCRMALENASVCFEQKRCFMHPLKKRNVMVRSPLLEYCAGAAALLNYHRVCDDLADEKGLKKWRARFAKPFVARARKKALKRGLAPLDASLAEGLARLSALEREAPRSVDAPAAVFGDILADILAFGLEESEAKIAAAAGRAIGRWIYIADALDDATEDAERGRYNPFLLLYGRVPTQAEWESIGLALKNELYGAEAAVDLLDIENANVKSIVYNVLYLGMPKRIEELSTAAEQKKKKKEKKHKRTSEDTVEDATLHSEKTKKTKGRSEQ